MLLIESNLKTISNLGLGALEKGDYPPDCGNAEGGDDRDEYRSSLCERD